MTKKKKVLIIVLSIVVVLAIAIGITCAVLFKEPEKPQNEGSIYQTKAIDNGMAGYSYISFDYVAEPEQSDENTRYGYVFHLWCSYVSSGGYQDWLSGYWELEDNGDGTFGTLTLTAFWADGATTYLAGAESGVEKIYELENGKYYIDVEIGGQGVKTIVFDPIADKVGEGETPAPPCTEHVDENSDGKCDNCGEDMSEEVQPGDVAMTLTATTAAGQSGKLELYAGNTWSLFISYYSGGEYTLTASGTYALDAAYNMVLTVTQDKAEVLPEDSYTLTCDYATQTYSGTIELKGVPVVGDITLNFAPEGSTPEEPPVCTEHVDDDTDGKCDVCGEDMPASAPEPSEALYTSNVASIYSGQGSAYLALEEGGVFNVYVTFGGNTSSWLNGTWTMENEVLTVTPSGGEAVNCPLTDKAYTVALSLPGAEVDFVIDMDENSVTYTVNYMLNDGTSTVYTAAEIKGNPAEAYITAAPAAPTREGYHFAGWHTRAKITDADIVNGVSKYMWFFGEKLSTTGVAKYGAMTEEERQAHAISEGRMLISDGAGENNTLTLYARWIKEKEISTAQQLIDIGNDLYGAYKLVSDITLTGEWTPIGAYFANYEYYNTGWWTYAFRGTLNGNGHKISGLKITSAEINKDYDSEGSVWFDDGVTCDGTAAMFAALAGANIYDLTLENPVINVTHSGDYLYVGSLAAFDMASSLTNVKVVNCDIDATFDEGAITFRANLFTVVAGLEAGGWSNFVTGCEVSGNITLNATNKLYHGGEIYLGGMLGENYSTLKTSKSDVVLSLDYKDEGTKADDAVITINVGGLSGSGTDITGSTVEAEITVKAVKAEGASSVNVGGIVGSQRYMVIAGNTVTAQINTAGTVVDEEAGALNVGGVGGRIDVYYLLQILAYTPIVQAGAQDNEQNVTVDGAKTDVVIKDAVSAVPGCWYIAKGDQSEYGATDNIDEVIAAYGSYLPKDSLQDGIIFIVNTPSQAE